MSQKTLLVREDRELLTDLPLEERAARGHELAQLLEDLAVQENEQATARAEAKTRMQELEARIDAARAIVLSGREKRTVTVEDWAHHDLGLVRSVRGDIDEVYFERAMTDAERQLPLDFVGPPPADATPA